MKRILFFLTILIVTSNYISAQQRNITRGAVPGEFYFSNAWYANYTKWGPPEYDTLLRAVYRITENGKKLTIQYAADIFADYYTEPGSVMQPEYILADATPGVLYNSDMDPFVNDRLWFSDDYGETWTLRDNANVQCAYFAANVEGAVYKVYNNGTGYYKSMDYGQNFYLSNEIVVYEPGLQYGEAFDFGSGWKLRYTSDFGENYMEISIAPEYVYGGLSGYFPDVFRGGLLGEVYVTSPFPGNPGYVYKVSFSADTGYNFRVVYQQNDMADFMSDRKAGDFYIVNQKLIETTQPWGWYNHICIKYYTEYGEILEAVFCHDLVRDYEYVENPCEHTTDLALEVMYENSIQLQWSNVADNIRGYHVFRNNMRITSEMLTGTTYLDENLPDGAYEYFVRAYYQEGCPSDSSNHVTKTIGEDETCEPVKDLAAEIVDNTSILLTWSEPEGDLTVEGYNIFRNNALLTEESATNTSYLDENLPNGDYEYYVITHYTDGCVSDSSNHVMGTIIIDGIETITNDGLRVTVYPNPANDELRITNYELRIENVEIFDLMGRVVYTVETRLLRQAQQPLASLQESPLCLDISHLPSGMYFVRIATENGVVTRKVVKR